MILLALLACDPEVAETPTLSFLSPTAGEETPLGVDVSLLVEHFVLEEEAASLWLGLPLALTAAPAWAHDDGDTPHGFVRLSLDGEPLADLTETTYSFLTDTGPHVLDAGLFSLDGDPLDVTASVSFEASE